MSAENFVNLYLDCAPCSVLFEGEEEYESMAKALRDINKYLEGGITSTGVRFTPWEGGKKF